MRSDRCHVRRPGLALAEQARQPPVLEHPAAGLARGAVVDRVLLEVDARDRRAADVARLAEPVVDAVGLRVVRAALAQLEPARELASIAAASRSTSSSRELGRERVGRELRARGGSRSPRRGRCRRSRAGRAAASAAAASRRGGSRRARSGPSPSASGPRCASSASGCSGREQPDAGALLLPGLGQDEPPPSAKRSWNAASSAPSRPASR